MKKPSRQAGGQSLCPDLKKGDFLSVLGDKGFVGGKNKKISLRSLDGNAL